VYARSWSDIHLVLVAAAHRRQVFKKLGDGGFLGVTKPVEYGGMGLDVTYGMAVSEELGAVCAHRRTRWRSRSASAPA
jgi:alkylation response protein AidB-like acyl-CoA dehydrogenase